MNKVNQQGKACSPNKCIQKNVCSYEHVHLISVSKKMFAVTNKSIGNTGCSYIKKYIVECVPQSDGGKIENFYTIFNSIFAIFSS